MRLSDKGEVLSLRTQAWFFYFRLLEKVIFFRVSKYIETFNEQALLLNRLFGCAVRNNLRGLSCTVGFPARMKETVVKRTLSAGYEVVFVDQGGMGPHVRERYVRNIYTRED